MTQEVLILILFLYSGAIATQAQVNGIDGDAMYGILMDQKENTRFMNSMRLNLIIIFLLQALNF